MDFFLIIVAQILIFIILSQSYNLVLGYGGMVHVGHIGFMAIGAYSSALLTVKAGVPFELGVFYGTLFAAFAGLILAIPTVRFREDYLVAATLGMGEIIRITLLNERQLTGGSTGVSKIARPEIFGVALQNNFLLVCFIFIITAGVLLFVRRVTHSPFGKAIESIREDEIAARALGKNVWLKKVQILVIAAGLAGLSGALYAHTVQFIDPEGFGLTRMMIIFLIVVAGGAGTFWGPALSAPLVYGIFEAMRFLPFPNNLLGPLRWITYGIILIIIIMLKPKGLLGEKLVRKKL